MTGRKSSTRQRWSQQSQPRRPQATPAPARAASPARTPKRPPSTRRAPARSPWSRRAPWIGAGAVAAVVAVLVIVSLLGTTAPAPRAGLAPEDVVEDVTGVPVATLDQVGTGTSANPPSALPSSTPPLMSDGRPRILYMGAEYCPYCAAERWALVQALSRFGTFSHLGATESSTTDSFPGTKTFTFHGAAYESPYLVFTPVETESNRPSGAGYAPLEQPTAEEQAIVSTYDVPPYVSTPRAIPFLDIAGRYVLSGTQVDPAALQGKSMIEIAEQLAAPSSPVAETVDGSANVITAAICDATGGRPGTVCTSQGVTRVHEMIASSG